MKTIQLTRGMETIVDEKDFELFSKHKWCFGTVGYAMRRANGKIVYLHREIIGANPSQFVDHINLNKLDNRRVNLRICTKQQNQQNQGSRGGTSKYKGVSLRNDTGKFSAQIHVNYKKISLGTFESEIEAARAYNQAALMYHGAFAKLNVVS